MRMITWNVNGYRSVCNKHALQALIQDYKPDIILLQEIKATADTLPWIPDGFFCFVNSGEIKGRHGTMTLIRNEIQAKSFQRELHRIDGCVEGRFQRIDLGEVVIFNTYTVNIRHELIRSEQRNLYDRFLLKQIRNVIFEKYVIMAGDFNTISEPIDIHRGKINPYEPAMSDLERGNFKEFLEEGLVDTFRHFHPSAREYTYWSNFGNARAKNLGWRLDYFLTDKNLVNNVTNIEILQHFKGSDHAPLIMDISLDL